MKRAIDMGPEPYTLLRYGTKLAKRHNLIAAGICKDRPVPAHETMQTAQARDAFRSGPKH